MTALMGDPSMWVRSEALDDVMAPPPPRLTFVGASRSRAKHRDGAMACGHCGRSVTALIFNDACTYECALALATAAYRYDYVYTAIMRQLGRGDVAMPKRAPPLHHDSITPERYWELAMNDLYSRQPGMIEFLKERLQKNAAPSRGGDKKRRAH